MISLIVRDAAAVVCQHAHSLRHVHRAATAKSDDAGRSAFFIESGRFIDDIGGRIRNDIQIGGIPDSSLFDDVLYLSYYADFLQSAVRD